MGWFTPERQWLVPTASACPLQCHLHAPGCVPSPLLFQHPVLDPKWCPWACPSRREAPRSWGRLAVLRSRKPQSTLPSNMGQIPISCSVRWTQCLGSTGKKRGTCSHHNDAFLTPRKGRHQTSTCTWAPKGRSSGF